MKITNRIKAYFIKVLSSIRKMKKLNDRYYRSFSYYISYNICISVSINQNAYIYMIYINFRKYRRNYDFSYLGNKICYMERL